MRNATIITCNSADVIQVAMIWHDETDENEVIQLTIGDYKYLFNNIGELQSTTGTISCATLSNN